ncbi:MAG: N-acetylmuramoyl-L-alanine amidase [Actinophytocola sp.]|nr:N-acetylmuramoyl-L-alanine amidase [Actinophytocola sp.]
MVPNRQVGRRTVVKGGLAATVIGAGAPGIAMAKSQPGPANEQPEIYSTADWEARPPDDDIVIEDHAPTYIVVHHTVEPANEEDFSREHAFEISRAIQNYHMDSRGWIDTGQQFTISRGGYITEGRHHSLETLQEGLRHVQGANVANRNSEVIGIENEGLYTKEDVPDALWDSLVGLVTYMAYQYDVPVELIKGHRDFNSTQCPGDVLYARMPELRRTVARRLRRPYPSEDQLEWPLLRPGDRGREVQLAQRLLRARGARDVPDDGVFGPATQAAVAALATAHRIADPGCGAARRAEERGLLGADVWPLLVDDERSTADWKALLARATPVAPAAGNP